MNATSKILKSYIFKYLSGYIIRLNFFCIDWIKSITLIPLLPNGIFCGILIILSSAAWLTLTTSNVQLLLKLGFNWTLKFEAPETLYSIFK